MIHNNKSKLIRSLFPFKILIFIESASGKGRCPMGIPSLTSQYTYLGYIVTWHSQSMAYFLLLYKGYGMTQLETNWPIKTRKGHRLCRFRTVAQACKWQRQQQYNYRQSNLPNYRSSAMKTWLRTFVKTKRGK